MIAEILVRVIDMRRYVPLIQSDFNTPTKVLLPFIAVDGCHQYDLFCVVSLYFFYSAHTHFSKLTYVVLNQD